MHVHLKLPILSLHVLAYFHIGFQFLLEKVDAFGLSWYISYENAPLPCNRLGITFSSGEPMEYKPCLTELGSYV